MAWFGARWFEGDWWSASWWAGVGVPPSVGGGGAVPEEFAFSIKNQRVSNHAAAAARSVLKPAGFLDDDEWVRRAQNDTAREYRKRIVDAKEEEDILILLTLIGFE